VAEGGEGGETARWHGFLRLIRLMLEAGVSLVVERMGVDRLRLKGSLLIGLAVVAHGGLGVADGGAGGVCGV